MESHHSVVEHLLHSTHVDDIISGPNSEDEAFEFYAQAKELFRCDGFNLRKFLTNSTELQLRINQTKGVCRQRVSMDPTTQTYAQAVLLGTQSPTEPRVRNKKSEMQGQMSGHSMI